ncbi:hypothetical protein BDV11DRAFT_7477 [Aspergillus similis]
MSLVHGLSDWLTIVGKNRMDRIRLRRLGYHITVCLSDFCGFPETTLIHALKPSMPAFSQHPLLNGGNHQTHNSAICFLAPFSIIIHGPSIPALNIVYKTLNVPHRTNPLSRNAHLPPNSMVNYKLRSILMYNRFSRS